MQILQIFKEIQLRRIYYCQNFDIEYLILFMHKSVASRASNASSQMLEEIANRSQTKIFRVEGTFNDEEMRIIWNALGLYISRNLRMGRGVNVPKLGIFTFTPPEVRLKGVTNQEQRDKQPRTPVFLVQKELVKGVSLRPAIFYHQDFGSGLRPYNALGTTGQVPITKMNLIEVSSYANMSKDSTELGLTRLFKYINQKLQNGGPLSLQIPNLGQLICRNHLVAVKFNEYLQRDTRNVLAKSVDERKLRGNMSLTSDNLRKFARISDMEQKLNGKTQQFFDIDDKARNFLQTEYNLHLDNTNFKRSVTNFDRTVATKAFDKTNQSLRDSQRYRLSQSGFFPTQRHSKQFNMALRQIRGWVHDNSYNSKESFEIFCKIARKGSKVLNENDLWEGCKQVCPDITEQQAQQVFRVLDSNKDGLITLQDWVNNIHFQNNGKFRELVSYIKKQGFGIAKVMKVLGLEGVRKVTAFTLRGGLRKLWPTLTQDQALLLSRHISGGKDDVEVEQVIDSLNISEGQVPAVDEEWQERFFSRLKRKMQEKSITQEELVGRFKQYDRGGSGYIEQADFKVVLGQIGISLNLNQLVKLVRCIPLDSNNKLYYEWVVDRLMSTAADPKTVLTQELFRKVAKEHLLNGKFPFPLPISVSKLSSLLQAKYFKQFCEHEVLKLARTLDINSDQQVTAEDLKGYSDMIREGPGHNICPVQAEALVLKLREKSIKKKISYYDLFKKLDKVGSGFITHEGWIKNIDQIVAYNPEEKEGLFAFMDHTGSRMIDYKTFLTIMNGAPNPTSSQKFDWVNEASQRIKDWFRNSKLTADDAFRVVDKDGDGYLGETDLHTFLANKLKYQERELSSVRIKKLMKLMDHYKRGRLSLVDWLSLIQQEANWLNQIKHQIGLILSKLYSSLGDAFTDITQGDQKMLYSAFQKWIRANHILSGFMPNQDILKTVFSNLDTHRKGYLLQNDFNALFASFNWKSEHNRQFLDFIKLKFESAQEAFRYMAEFKNTSISYDRFKKVINEFFGNRFHQKDVQRLWSSLVSSNKALDFARFKKLYGDLWKNPGESIDKEYPQDTWQYQDFSIIKGTTVRSGQFSYEDKEKMEDQCEKFIQNLRQFLASSPKTLEQAFLDVDKKGVGKITNLQFKRAFRVLNIALTSREIDLLLNYSGYEAGHLIEWRPFIKKLELSTQKKQIRSRLQPKLQHLSDLLHYYMISPKDAYRKWNNPRTGYMNFQEFNKMLRSLYEQAAESLPQFAQLQDLFHYIDLRKDKQIDFQEWTQVFRNCTPPSLLMGTTPAPSEQLLFNRLKDPEEQLPTRERSMPLFRHSPQYQKFVHVVGRNRNYLREQIELLNSEKTAFISFDSVQGIIHDFCMKQGVKVAKGMVRNLIAFAMTGEKVDYQLLVAKFKDMSQQIAEFPKKKVF